MCVASATDVETQLADQLGQLFGWSRFGFYDLLAKRAGIDIDLSSMLILGALTRLGPCRTTTLAELMGLDPSTVSRHVAKVVDRGWASRSADVKDGRATVISLTSSGKRVRERLWGQWGRVIREVTATWTPEERESFLELISRLYGAVTALSPKFRPAAALQD